MYLVYHALNFRFKYNLSTILQFIMQNNTRIVRSSFSDNKKYFINYVCVIIMSIVY